MWWKFRVSIKLIAIQVGKDDSLGSLTISIKSLMEKILNGVEADWWSLEKTTSGSINLSFSFDPRPKRGETYITYSLINQ